MNNLPKHHGAGPPEARGPMQLHRLKAGPVYGHSCRFKFYHTRNNNRLDRNIGLNKHKLILLVNDNTAECNVTQKKKLS